ncbi:MAG TPA: cation:proton antiporter, partial [Actinomycetota bacterium]|nr:cation:proton antiporter [Actinomycetota bacterium]
LLLGAILASTDPVVLRDVLRDRRLPRSVRAALGIEAGTNDVVVLPVILVLVAVANAEVGGVGGWARFALSLFVVGPAAGFAVGAGGAWLMSRADAAFGIRRTYQSLFGVGLVLAAYVAGVAVGGDGFLAAFAGGLAVTVLNQSLCDCFLEFGESAAEMSMLVAFVLFGALLSTQIPLVPVGPAVLLAVLAIVVIRPLAIGAVLVARSRALSRSARLFIAWFGPRGLNSLLFALIVVHADVPGSDRLLAATGVVVVVSVLAHGASATPLSSWYAARLAETTLSEERTSLATGLFEGPDPDVPRTTVEELAALLASPAPPVVMDVRSRSSYEHDGVRIPGDVRVPPDQVDEWARERLENHPVVLYCT